MQSLTTHWFTLAWFVFIAFMQSLMLVLSDVHRKIIAAKFGESQWIWHRTGLFVETLPSAVVWQYIDQHKAAIIGNWIGGLPTVLILQFPLVAFYMGLSQRRRWQNCLALMLWAWPIVTPLIIWNNYRALSPLQRQRLRAIGIGLGFIGLIIFAFFPHQVIHAIPLALGYLIGIPLLGTWFAGAGVFMAGIQTFSLLSGNLGFSGEWEREGLSYFVSLLGYFELLWFGLWLYPYLIRCHPFLRRYWSRLQNRH